MNLFLKPKPGSVPMLARFKSFTDKVKSAQEKLRENQRNKIREETLRLKEQIAFRKSQERLEHLRLKASKKLAGGGFGGYY